MAYPIDVQEERRRLMEGLPPDLRVLVDRYPGVLRTSYLFKSFITQLGPLFEEVRGLDNRSVAVKDLWYNEESFLQQTLRGKLVLYLRWLRAQLKNNPVFAIDHRHDFANAIRNQYKDEEIAKNIEELKFPTHLGFLEEVKRGVNSWGAAGNINDYVRLSQYYGEQIKKLFGEKAHRIIDKKEGIKQLRWLQEEFLYLGSGRYISKIDGKGHMGMLFMALKGVNEPEWQDFLKMIKKLKGEEHEIKKLFGDRRTVTALIACKKRYGELPEGWIRTLEWLTRRDLPSRYTEVISKAQKEWLEAVKEVEVVVHDELKKDIGKYESVLKKGENEWVKKWSNSKGIYNEKDNQYRNIVALIPYSIEPRVTKIEKRLKDSVEPLISKYFGEVQESNKWILSATEYTKSLRNNELLWINAIEQYLPTIDRVESAKRERIKAILAELEKTKGDEEKAKHLLGIEFKKLAEKIIGTLKELVSEAEKTYELLNLKKAPGIVLPKPAIPTTLPTEEEVKATAIRNYPNIPVDVAITMENDRRTREEAMKQSGFPAGTPERRTGGPIYR